MSIARLTKPGALIVTALVSLLAVFSLACGSSGGNARSISGTIDSSVISSDTGDYEIWATKGGSYLKQGTLSISETGDSSYTIDGLVDGQVYKVELVRAVSGDKVPVLSTVVVASSTSGTVSAGSSKARQAARAGVRQMNVLTTYIANSILAETADAISSALTSVIGAGYSIDDLSMSGGQISVGVTKVVVSSPLARIAMTQVTLSVAATVTMTSANVASSSVALKSFLRSVSTATTVENIVSAVNTGSALKNIIEAASTAFATALVRIDTVTATVLARNSSVSVTNILAAVSNASLDSFLADSGTIYLRTGTAAGITVDVRIYLSVLPLSTAELDSAVNNAIEGDAATSSGTTVVVSSFTLANSNYGSKMVNTNNFKINTLAPVFKVVLSSALTTTFDNLVTVSITSPTGSISNTTLSATAAPVTSVADGKIYYLFVKKSSSTTLGDNELNPGTAYSYSIAPKSGVTLYYNSASSASVTGTITTDDLTVTYPVATPALAMVSSTAVVLAETTPVFLFHSKNPIAPTDTTALLETVTFKVDGNAANTSALTISDNTAYAAKVTVSSSAGLVSGVTYALDITKGTSADADIPASFPLTVEVQ